MHRIGRTARAGATGDAVSFCDHEEIGDLRAIERLIDMKLEVALGEPDLVFDQSAIPASSSPGRKRGGSPSAQGSRGGSPGGSRGGTGRRKKYRSRGGRSRRPAA